MDTFWSTLAFVANALVFLLVGIQLNPLSLFSNPATSGPTLLIALRAVGVVLLARLLLVVGLSVRVVVLYALILGTMQVTRAIHIGRRPTATVA